MRLTAVAAASAAASPLAYWWSERYGDTVDLGIRYLVLLATLLLLVVVAPATLLYGIGYWIAALVRWRQANTSVPPAPGPPSARETPGP